MSKKQEQKVGNNSTAIQAGGDVNVLRIPYKEIKEIFLDLFKSNFPEIQQVAREEANRRINELLLTELHKSLEKHAKEIDSTRFSEPSLQYDMQTMAINVARRPLTPDAALRCSLKFRQEIH
ncbi:MAG: hypothetical protein GY821_04860 [Gammaproteobacteria bacterium]|nr:hypothetical protein [Gammaproteobacteria bacterium]